MSHFQIRVAQPFIAALILIVAGTQPAFSQSTQHRQTDLQFVTRMNQEAAQMLIRASDLEKRLRQVEATTGPMPQTKEHILLGRQVSSNADKDQITSRQGSSAGEAETRASERLRHKNRAVSDSDMKRLRRELRSLKSQIRQEQKRLKSKNFDQQKSVKDQQKRMKKLDARLRRIQKEIIAFN